MKFLTAMVLCLLSVNVFADCEFLNMNNSKSIYVVPSYTAKVNLVFEKDTNSAFAQVSWALNEAETKGCFNMARAQYPNDKVVIPTVRVDDLYVRVLGNDQQYPIKVFQQANGHWNGLAEMIKIPFSQRSKYANAIKEGEAILEMSGKIGFRMTTFERKIVGNVQCIEKGEAAGILNLYKRIGEIKTTLEKRDKSEEVNIEEVLQDFFGQCVMFQPVEAKSLKEFDQAQRVNSRIVQGNLYFKGSVKKEVVQPMPAMTSEEPSILDI